MRTGLGLGFILAAVTAAGSAAAMEPAGSAVAVIQQASADLSGQTLVLEPGDALFMGQTVITGPDGQVQVVFNDNTHLVVGPGSSLVIAEYLMRNDQTASKFVINALSGTFRFVTGNSPKNAYEIQTPTGTIGVRGTAFDFGIDPETRETHVLLYHGGVRMCDEVGGCTEMADTCAVGIIPDHAQAAVLNEGDKRKPPILSDFPYLKSERPLRDDFRIPGYGRCRSIEVAEAETAPIVAEAPPPPPPPP
ncbi:MAG: FecR domain-containing protein, partial [Devosia sp.]